MAKINKYWSNDFMKWIEGYKFFGIYFIKLTLYKEKTKYKILFKLPSKYKPYHDSKISFDKNEFENFLNEIRNGKA